MLDSVCDNGKTYDLEVLVRMTPAERPSMRYISLFSGVAGLDVAIDALGGECWVQVEKEPYCRSILDLRYPDVPKVDNIFGYHATADTVDLVVGGPPCQPVSHAGRRKGTDDERWLWGEALRIVAEAKPSRVFFENPMGLRTMGLDTVLDGLTELGYGGADAFEAEPGEYAKEDRDDLLNDAENAASDLLAAVPAAWKKGK